MRPMSLLIMLIGQMVCNYIYNCHLLSECVNIFLICCSKVCRLYYHLTGVMHKNVRMFVKGLVAMKPILFYSFSEI